MKLDEVVGFLLKDAEIRKRTKCTLDTYRRVLGVLLRLLHDVSKVTELERVTVYHLRDCVQHLSTVSVLDEERLSRPGSRQGRMPTQGILSTSSVRVYIRVWKAFFHWCFLEELLEKDVTARLTMPKPEKRVRAALTVDHVQRMLSVIDTTTPLGFRDYAILVLLLDTGMRLAEIRGVTVEDVHEGYIKVFGKGRKEREIGLSPEVHKLLWKYIHKYRSPADANEHTLFLGRSGEAMTVGGIKQVVTRIKLESGISDIRVSPHVFRHTFAKMYMEQGGDLLKLSRELGHSDVQTTKIYLEDFGSTEARRNHASYSPIAQLHLDRQQRGKRKKKE